MAEKWKVKKKVPSCYSTCHDIIKITNNPFQHAPFSGASGLHSIVGKLVTVEAQKPGFSGLGQQNAVLVSTLEIRIFQSYSECLFFTRPLLIFLCGYLICVLCNRLERRRTDCSYMMWKVRIFVLNNYISLKSYFKKQGVIFLQTYRAVMNKDHG